MVMVMSALQESPQGSGFDGQRSSQGTASLLRWQSALDKGGL